MHPTHYSETSYADINNTAREYPREKLVHEIFAEQAEISPDAIALTLPSNKQSKQHIDGGSWSYAELNNRADSLAKELKAASVRGGDRVGILLERSLNSVAAILAVLKAGAAFVPLDSSYPEARSKLMIETAALRLLVADHSSMRFAKGFGCGSLVVDDAGGTTLKGVAADVSPEPMATERSLTTAYIMFTSGSTGTPKGVCIPHRGIIRLVRGSEFTTLDNRRVFLQLAPACFDASTLELWGPLLNGGHCVLYPGPSLPDPGLLAAIVEHYGVTTLWLTASLFNTLVDEAIDCLLGVQEIITGGEALSAPHLRRAQQRFPSTKLINGYGPTESTTFAACYRVPNPLPEELSSVPIGSPISNTRIYLTDSQGQLVASGEEGEICIAGDGLANGYYGTEDLSSQHFVERLIGDGKTGRMERLYLTGDRARQLPSGELQFLGRLDDQVKLRGHRIELAEIEAVLRRHPGVADAVAALQPMYGEKRLVAYFTPDETAADTTDSSVRPSAKTLAVLAAQYLPAAMLPAAFLELEALPLTPNGKVDRNALPLPDNIQKGLIQPETASNEEDVDKISRENGAPISSLPAGEEEWESQLIALWSELLGGAIVVRERTFFELGGTSLLALKMVSRLNQRFGLQLRIASVFEHNTVPALAARLATDNIDGRDFSPQSMPEETTVNDNRGAIAVIGMAGRFPGAASVQELWQVLIEGRHTETHFRTDELDPSLDPAITSRSDYVPVRGVLDDIELFDASYFDVSPREAEIMDPQQRVFLEEAVHALEAAGVDPQRYPGSIGLFAGSGNTTYFNDHLRPQPEIIERAGALLVRLGNEKDFLVTRVAHQLGLTGPAVAINTACSTSLVAIAHAFRALLAADCDIALAGGVSIHTPSNSGHIYDEGSMLSPDGCCRPFDVDAHGTCFNDGVGLVVLKRLDEAVADGDHIHAVLRGVGMNNDGADKMSFSAPSVEGQAQAIRRALQDARVRPDQISYIEAHGTATPIGDPIEITALTRALGGSERCALSSVKSNVGHTVSAAGVTGFIKTVLCLEHQTLPATVHFNRANPHLELEQTPFWVVDKTQEWTEGARPLRAGVSSFGVGGTNAHVILEQAPECPVTVTESSPQVLALSAKTPEGFRAQCSSLADYLEQNPDLRMGDVSRTLDIGRSRHRLRASVVASNTAECAASLRSLGEPLEADPRAQTAWLFPGQGAQYSNMGIGLAESNAEFQEAFQQCVAWIDRSLYNHEGKNSHSDSGESLIEIIRADDGRLNNTRYTQPALFAVQYALSCQLSALGIKPTALIGHSVGEFAAAVTAGIMRAEDAAMLVTERGRLLSELEQGAMTSVQASRSEMEPLLISGVEIAAENSPNNVVVAGSFTQIEKVESALSKEDIAFRRLHTSHAFHTAVMEPAIEPFTCLVSEVVLNAPQIPVVSTATGNWLTAAQATSPQYWGEHLRRPVLFGPAIALLLEDTGPVMIEAGPRNTLTALTRQQPAARDRRLFTTLSDNCKSEAASFKALMGNLWSAGIDVPVSDSSAKKLSPPGYPFQRQRYWIDIPKNFGMLNAAANSASAELESAAQIGQFASEPGLTNGSPHVEGIETAELSRQERIQHELVYLLEELSGYELMATPGSANFLELGLDSLILTQAAQAATKHFGVKLKLRDFSDSHSTIDAMVAHLDTKLPDETFVAPQSAATSSALEISDADRSKAVVSGAHAVSKTNTRPDNTAGRQPNSIHDSMRLRVTPTPAASKGHGPQLVISKSAEQQLSPTQQRHLERLNRDYTERTAGSKAFTQRNRAHLADPRVVSGFRPPLKELVYPIVVERSSGCRLWDVDGNEYVDLLNGYGSNFFGYGAEFARKALNIQMQQSMEIGPQSRLVEEVTALFREFVPMERVAYCNTGSEAVLAALRMARTATSKDLVVMFEGGYHGMFDEVVVRTGARGKTIPAAPGIPRGAVENILVLPWDDKSSFDLIRDRADEIAAVLVEPVQSRRPDIQPVAFLRTLRDLTRELDIAYIFDEVVTGFRVAPGGAQQRFDIQADIATFGKVIGAGISIGIVAGERRFLDALDGGDWQYGDDSIPEVGVTYFAGTFVRHPLSLAVSRAALLHMKQQGAELQSAVDAITEDLVERLNKLFEQENAPITADSFSSILRIEPGADQPYGEILFYHLRKYGVHVWAGRPCFLTTEHGQAEIKFIVDAFRESILDLQKGGFYPPPVKRVDDKPAPGARLGRDQDGNPAWYLPDPENPDSYKRIEPEN